MSADIASYYSGDSDSLDPDPIRIPTMCESSAHEKKKGCDSSLGITLEKKKRKNKGQLHVVDRIQILKMVLGKRRGVGRLSKCQSTTRHTKYTQTQVPTQQSLEKIQRLERLIIELQNQVQHISKKLPVEHCLPPDNKKEELIRKHGNMHSTRPSQHHMSHMFGNGDVSSSQPLTSHSNIQSSQYQGQMSMLPPSQQPSSTPYYPNMYNSASQQLPPTPYQYPYMYGAPSQQPLPPYHYPNTYGFPLQQPMPPHHNPNTYGLPLQQPTPPYHNPNTNGAPSHQPKPPDHHPSMYGPLSQQPPMPKVSTGPDPKPQPSLLPDNTKDACPKREHTTQDILDHPESQAGKKARNMFLGFNIWEKLMEFSKMNRLKRRAFFEISVYMVENDACLKAFFNRMDVSSRGMINMDELIAAFKLSLPCPSVDLLMKIGDLDKDGYLDYLDFVNILVKVRILGNENKHIRAAFEVFDENQSGYIEMDDLRHCFDDGINVEENIEEVVEAIMEDVDIDKDGKISYDEFARLMKSYTDWRRA